MQLFSIIVAMIVWCFDGLQRQCKQFKKGHKLLVSDCSLNSLPNKHKFEVYHHCSMAIKKLLLLLTEVCNKIPL